MQNCVVMDFRWHPDLPVRKRMVWAMACSWEIRIQAWPFAGRCLFAFPGMAKGKQVADLPSRFTPSRLSRKGASAFPSLSAKAVSGKVLSFWLAAEAANFAARHSATELEKLVSACVTMYAEVLRALDQLPLLLTEVKASDFQKLGMTHLQLYAALHRQTASQHLYALLPKHHYFLHMVEDMDKQRINANCYTLLTAESFIGIIGRIGRRCHKSSVSFRTCQRYLFQLKTALDA